MSVISWVSNLNPFNWGGRTRRSILGSGAGKFGPAWGFHYFPANEKLLLVDCSPGGLMQVAMEVPHLNTVISTGAELFSMMEIKHMDKNGEEIENSPVLDLLRQPNPAQTQEQFTYEFYVQNAVYSKTFQHMVRGLSFALPKAIWLLPSGFMEIIATGKIYRQTDITEIIQSYVLRIAGAEDDVYDPANVIYMSEGIGTNMLMPASRIETLKIPLSNIYATLKSRNIFISQRGPNGIFSGLPNKTEDGMIPFSEKEADRLRLEFKKKFDLDNQGGHIAFSTGAMQFLQTSFDVKQLGLEEGMESDFSAIIAAYRHDRDIYPSVKGATFENKSAGMKSTIQNAIQPLADKLMRSWTKNFLDPASGEYLEACYDHLPAMKEDERTDAQAQLYKAQTADILLKNGTIDHDGAAIMVGVDMTGSQEIMTAAINNYQQQNGQQQEN